METTGPVAESTPASVTVSQTPARSARLVSLDVFRGITIAGMLLVNNPGKGQAYAALDHAEWNGWTPTDLVFPFFLFIVGVAIPFSMARRSATLPGRGAMLGRIWIRALSLFMLGALLHGFSYSGVRLNLGERAAGTPLLTLGALPDGFLLLKTVRAVAWGMIPFGMVALLAPYRSRRMQWSVPVFVTVVFYALMGAVALANRHAFANGLPGDTNLGGGIFRPGLYRIPGILQRIGACYGVAATLALFFGTRMLVVWLVLLLSTYSALMLKCPFKDHVTGSLTREDNLGRKIDEAVFDRWENGKAVRKHTYGHYPDPEGLLSTIPAIGTVVLGILVGLGLRRDRPAAERCARLLAWGVVVTLLGCGLDKWLMPVNKSIWTPSFAMFCGGLAMLGLGTLFYVIDVLGRRRWALPLVIYGMNAIAAFIAAGMVVRLGIIVHVGKDSLVTRAQETAVEWVGGVAAWLQQFSSHIPNLATGANESLAYALFFVIVVGLLMSVLYVCRIFIKV